MTTDHNAPAALPLADVTRGHYCARIKTWVAVDDTYGPTTDAVWQYGWFNENQAMDT